MKSKLSSRTRSTTHESTAGQANIVSGAPIAPAPRMHASPGIESTATTQSSVPLGPDSGRLEQPVKNWLEKNKIFFETIAAFLVSIAGIIVACVAISISKRQADIADQQTTLIKQQTDLAAVQADIARVDISPDFYFDFDYGSVSPFAMVLAKPGAPALPAPRISIINKGKPIRRLDGDVTAFLEIERSPTDIVRIELANLFIKMPEELKHGLAIESQASLWFNLHSEYDEMILQQFHAKNASDHGDGGKYPRSLWPVDLKFYVNLRYFDSTRTHCQDEFVFLFPNRRTEPVKGKPKMDFTVDMQDGQGPFSTIDAGHVYGQVEALILKSLPDKMKHFKKPSS